MVARNPPQEVVDECNQLIASIQIESNPRGGIAIARHSLELAQRHEWDLGIALAHASVAVCCANAGDLEDAKKHYQLAIPALERLDSRKSLRVRNNYANLLAGNEPELSLPIHRSVYQDALAAGDMSHAAAVALLGLGNDYESLGDLDRYVDYNFQALQLAKENDFPEIVSVATVNLAEGFLTLGDLPTALEHCREAISVEERLGNIRMVTVMKVVLSKVYLQMGLLEEAAAAAQDVLRGTELLGMERPSIAMQLLGKVAALQGNESDAILWFERAMHGTHNAATRTAMLGMAKIVLNRDPQRAIEILMELLPLAQTSGDKQSEAGAHLALSECFNQVGKLEGALGHFKQYYEINTRILDEQTQKQLLRFRVEREMDKHEAEARDLRLQKNYLERQLTTTTLQLVSQTELLSELRDGLLQFVRKFPMPDGTAKELRDRLKTLPCKSVDWERFDTQFRAAHPEFTKKLLANCPDLTPTEVRICSLLRMNLRSIEIAKLLCLSERSVEGHRTHVRKKMKLNRGEELMHYLVKL